MEHSVQEQIRQYRVVSKSRRFTNLQYKNVTRIAKALNRSTFNGLLDKKNYYTQKLYKLLNDSLPDEAVEDTPLDSQVITNRFLAQKYLEWAVKDDSVKETLARLIEDHTLYQKEMMEKRLKLAKELDAKYSKTDKLYQQELDKFDADLYKRLEMIESNSVYKLKKLMIPYFCLHDHYAYPDLDKDKVWVLEHIQKLIH